ncbi:MAG TPA: hypothetical protein VFN67_37500 [Polyangiales bacterium]|nr:hypothetical protein [Polyangiales bacterium]
MKNSATLPAVVLGAAGLTIAGIAAIAAASKREPGQQPQQPGKKPAPQQPPPAANGGEAEYSPEVAASMLKLYLTSSNVVVDWGSKQSPNPIIAKAQRDMGGITADGIYGPKTQARGAALTLSSWPARPVAKPAAKLAAKPASSIPSNPVKVTSSTSKASSSSTKTAAERAPTTAAPAPNRPPGATTVDLPAQVVSTERSPKQAAQALHTYATGLVRSGRGAAELGSKAKPNDFVAAAQRDMRGGLASDGIYGPKTQARGKELLGVEFPNRYGTGTKVKPPVPPLTAANEQQRAAEGLLSYLSQPGADQGVKGKPSAYVKAAQAAMGGLTADGIYGPNTRTRGAALTGKPFPPRR